MMKQILREKDLPEELFYLALIESGFNPQAQSRAKASGIWQFMAKTAKRFGLKVDKWVDERRDPEKSTYAAAEYLKNLHEMFNCWYLATASYNAGEGKVLEAMKRAKSQDFWEISKHKYLRRETKEYVPMLLAAMIIAEDPQKYGFSQINYHPPLSYEKAFVPPGTRLDRIARAAETNVAEIRVLNPSLIRDKTPPDGNPYEIKLPPGKRESFERNFPNLKKMDLMKAKKHQVRRGETLGQISKKYRVSLQDLCAFNQISPKNLIQPGIILLVPPS
jgi:membrane-bound lytic murein transglycosylase D